MISQSQRFLLELLKASLFDEEIIYPSAVDWENVISEAKFQTVIGLISSVIPVRDEASEHVKATYLRIMYEQDRLVKLFDSAQIPCVILKGSSAAIYYPKPFLRTMGDIDVLVPKCRFTESLELLESNGYFYDHGKRGDEEITEDTRELAYTKNGICIEIHQKFSSPGVDIDDILDKAIERRVYCQLNGFSFPILPSLQNGLVLLAHINQHLKTSKLGLRQIVDWQMYVYSVEDKVSWSDQFIPLLKKTGLLTLAAYVTRLCNLYLGLPDEIGFEVNVDDSLVDELLEVILTDGNFGSKYIADKSVDEKKTINASYDIKRVGFFYYFTHIGLSTSRFCIKHPSFKIYAFIYGFFRLLCKGIIAIFKNKNVGKNIYELHSKRQELYKKLGVRMKDE